jgi:hypothetical protein
MVNGQLSMINCQREFQLHLTAMPSKIHHLILSIGGVAAVRVACCALRGELLRALRIVKEALSICHCHF